jgi:hypothetical protein
MGRWERVNRFYGVGLPCPLGGSGHLGLDPGMQENRPLGHSKPPVHSAGIAMAFSLSSVTRSKVANPSLARPDAAPYA